MLKLILLTALAIGVRGTHLGVKHSVDVQHAMIGKTYGIFIPCSDNGMKKDEQNVPNLPLTYMRSAVVRPQKPITVMGMMPNYNEYPGTTLSWLHPKFLQKMRTEAATPGKMEELVPRSKSLMDSDGDLTRTIVTEEKKLAVTPKISMIKNQLSEATLKSAENVEGEAYNYPLVFKRYYIPLQAKTEEQVGEKVLDEVSEKVIENVEGIKTAEGTIEKIEDKSNVNTRDEDGAIIVETLPEKRSLPLAPGFLPYGGHIYGHPRIHGIRPLPIPQPLPIPVGPVILDAPIHHHHMVPVPPRRHGHYENIMLGRL